MPRLPLFCCSFLCSYYSRVATIWGWRLFPWKPTDINNGWIRYVQAIQWWILDAVNSTWSISVLLSAVETSRTTQTIPVTVTRNYLLMRVCATYILPVATIQGSILFYSELWLCGFCFRRFEGGNYFRTIPVWINTVYSFSSESSMADRMGLWCIA